MQIRPYFDILYNNTNQFSRTSSWLGYIEVAITDSEKVSKETGSGIIYIKNIGNGPAMNFNINVAIEGVDDDYQAFFTNQNSLVSANSIQQGKDATVSVSIRNCKEAPKKDEMIWDDNDLFASFDFKKYVAPKSFVMRAKITYNDLLFNQFEQ